MINSDGFPKVRSGRLDWKLPFILGLFVLTGLLALNDVLVYTPDSARYLLWAKSLASLQGFADLSIPEPFHYVVHAPLYSVLLAPLSLIAPDNVLAAKVLTLTTGACLLAAFFYWLRNIVGGSLALAGVVVLAANPLTILFSNQLLSDVPFALSVILVFILAERVISLPENPAREFLFAMALCASMLLREVGVTLYLAAVLVFLARKEYGRLVIIGLLPLALYGAWFLRNEIIVAGVEHPPLRNSEIFLLRYFTGRESSFISELFARWQVNAPLYADHIVRLLFLPQYGASPYGVILTTDPPYSLVVPAVPALMIIFGFCSLGLAVYGGAVAVRQSVSGGLLTAFIPVYLLLIMSYPFNDVRFLLPLLLIMIAGGMVAIREIGKRFGDHAKRYASWSGLGFLVVALIPNVAWAAAFVRDNAAYRSSPERFYESVAGRRAFPDMLTKPMSRVGEWITRHHAAPAMVLTQWKELSLWLKGGKLVELNTLVPLDEFERFIRDYRVTHVVSAVGLAGIPEFYPQMQLSRRFKFNSAYRLANLEVFTVHSASSRFEGVQPSSASDSLWQAETRTRGIFSLGLGALERGEADSAMMMFRALADMTGGGNTMVLYLAIAHEFAGEEEQAKTLLAGLQAMKQAGPFLGHAAYHREIIELTQQAETAGIPEQRAELFHVASVKMWNIGFHRQSLALLDSSLSARPDFAPSLIFGVYYNLELERWKEAARNLRRLMNAFPDHPMVDPLRRMVAYHDSIRTAGRPAARHVLELANAYEAAGLGDSAIRELRAAADSGNATPEILKKLAALYVAKRRYYPALVVLDDLLRHQHSDPEIVEMHRTVAERW